MQKKKAGATPGKKKTAKKPQAKPAASKKPRATAANNAANVKKRIAQTSKAAATPPSKKSANVAKDHGQQAAPKNASRAARGKVAIGGTVKTKDKYLPYDPKNVQELKDRRWVVVIDKNTNEELAVVRLTDEKQRNTTELPTYRKGNKRKTYFKHFVEIEDNEGNAIRVDGKKFIKNAEKYNVSKEELNIIQSVVRAHCKQAQSNKDNLKKLKDKK